MADAQFVTNRQESLVTTHRVLKNTYMLLSMTLLFSAAMAGVSIAVKAPHLGFIPFLIGFFGLYFLVSKTRNSIWGIFSVFLLTGFLGFTLGPIVDFYVQTTGSQTVTLALGMTGLIFLSLSGYTLISRKDFSYLSGFLTVGFVVIVCSFLVFYGAAYFFDYYISGLHLALSAAIVVLMSGFILYETSQIIHGGETNYIMATVSLYISIYNIFLSLLHIFGALGGDD